MRSLLALLLLLLPALAFADPPRRPHVTVLPTVEIHGRRAEFILLARSRDRYEPPPLDNRENARREIVRTVRRSPF
jgi:hypothetical protein